MASDAQPSMSSDVEAEDQPLLLVTSDSHVGPRVREDLRPYCEKEHLEAFDGWSEHLDDGLARHYEHWPEKMKEAILWNLQSEGHYDVHARLRDMDADGIAAEVIFHGSQNAQPIPFDQYNIFGSGLNSPEDAAMTAVGRHIYNRWLADFCSVEPERHVGLAQVPLWDIEASIREVEWAANAGLGGVNFPKPDSAGVPPLTDPQFERFYAACADHEMPLTTHTSGSFPGNRYDSVPGLSFLEGAWWCERSIRIMTMHGVFERHPNLRLVITETPGTWFSAMVADTDSMMGFGGNAYVREHDRYSLPRMPSSYIGTNVWIGASFQSRQEAETAIADGHADRMMWGTDYPHQEGTWCYPEPGAPSMTHLALWSTYSGLPIADVRGMVGLNAIACYSRLDLDDLRKVSSRISAPRPSQILEHRPIGTKEPHNHSVSSAFRTVGAWS
jgi:predicted TIM-barrel fold metal-dependent hydrolase